MQYKILKSFATLDKTFSEGETVEIEDGAEYQAAGLIEPVATETEKTPAPTKKRGKQ